MPMLFNTERERDRREISVKMIIKWYDVIEKKKINKNQAKREPLWNPSPKENTR